LADQNAALLRPSFRDSLFLRHPFRAVGEAHHRQHDGIDEHPAQVPRERFPAAWQVGLQLVAEAGDSGVSKGQPVNAMGELVPDLPN